MLALLLLLFPTPAPCDSVAGAWVLEGSTWPGWTVRLGEGGAYSAQRGDDPNTLWVGEWSLSRGVLAVRERPVRWGEDGPAVGGWTRYEWDGVRVRGGVLSSGDGRLTGRRAE